MSGPPASDRRVALAGGHRLQYEPAQEAYVLLYPEGLVELSDTAAAVLERCAAPVHVAALVEELRREYDGADLEDDVREFLEDAHARGWIVYA